MPQKKPKKEPPIVVDVSPADGTKAAARLSAVRVAKTAETIELNDDVPSWFGTCAICFDLLPVGVGATFYECCCNSICTVCHVKCRQHDERCPLCRAPARTSDAECVHRLQKHVDKGNAKAQIILGTKYLNGDTGLKQDFKRGVQLYQIAAAQGNAVAQHNLGLCHARGQGVEIDHKTVVQWYRRAAEQGFPASQNNLGDAFYYGKGVAQSYDEAAKWYRLTVAQGESNALFGLGLSYAYGRGVAQSFEEAVKWWRLAAAQDHADALFNLGACHANGQGVPQDLHEALRLCKRAAAKGQAGAAAAVDTLLASLAAARAA